MSARDLALAGLLILLCLMLLALVLMPSKNQKRLRARLDRLQSRFMRPSQNLSDPRSIRLSSKSGVWYEPYIPRRAEIELKLARAGFHWHIGTYISIMTGLFLFVFFITWLLGFSFFMAFSEGVFIGISLPQFVLNYKIKRRASQFLQQFPDALELMVRGVKSGMPVNEAIATIAREIANPMGEEFGRISDAMRLGRTLEEALWQASDRLELPEFKFFVISLVIQRETGGSLAETLANLAGLLRQRQSMVLKVRALSSEARASAWIIGALPFLMYGVIFMMNPSYASILYTHPKAILASIVGLVWMSMGIAIMAKMIRFEV